MEYLISNPSALTSLIASNSELAAASKYAQVTTDVNKNNIIMATIVRAQSKQLATLAPMAPDTFMKSLLKTFGEGGEGVDWLDFGKHTSAYFREPPCSHGLNHMCVIMCEASAKREARVRSARNACHGKRSALLLRAERIFFFAQSARRGVRASALGVSRLVQRLAPIGDWRLTPPPLPPLAGSDPSTWDLK